MYTDSVVASEILWRTELSHTSSIFLGILHFLIYVFQDIFKHCGKDQ